MRRFAFIIALALNISALTALAGESGTIKGKVIDKESKQPVPNVNVLVIGTKIGSVTGLNGTFTIEGVEENVYRLKYSCLGYTNHVENEIRVIHDKVTTVKEIELSESEVVVDSVVYTPGSSSGNR